MWRQSRERLGDSDLEGGCEVVTNQGKEHKLHILPRECGPEKDGFGPVILILDLCPPELWEN